MPPIVGYSHCSILKVLKAAESEKENACHGCMDAHNGPSIRVTKVALQAKSAISNDILCLDGNGKSEGSRFSIGWFHSRTLKIRMLQQARGAHSYAEMTRAPLYAC